MHRIEGANYQEIAGKKYFTEGPPGTTIVDDWLNAVQEELCKVITDAGLSILVESIDTRDQLAEAIVNRNADFAMASGKGLDLAASVKGLFAGCETESWVVAASQSGSNDPIKGANEADWVLSSGQLESDAGLPVGGGMMKRVQDNGGSWVFGFQSTGYYIMLFEANCANTIAQDLWPRITPYTSDDNGVTWKNSVDGAAGIYGAGVRKSCAGPSQYKVTDTDNDLVKMASSVLNASTNLGWPNFLFIKLADL